MNKFSIAISALAIVAPKIASADCVNSYWIPFDAELYMPESEASIELRAFEKNSIPKSVAQSLDPKNFPTDQAQSYNPKNVRAMVRMPEAEIYVDRFGWIRQGGVYGKADVLKVEEKLSTPCADK